MMSQGDINTVLETIMTIDKEFLHDCPQVYFYLKFFEFYTLIGKGDMETSLTIMRSILSPISLQIKLPELMEAVKCGMLLLAFGSDKSVPPSILLRLEEFVGSCCVLNYTYFIGWRYIHIYMCSIVLLLPLIVHWINLFTIYMCVCVYIDESLQIGRKVVWCLERASWVKWATFLAHYALPCLRSWWVV